MMRKLRPSVQKSLRRKARSFGSAASRSVLNRSDPCAYSEDLCSPLRQNGPDSLNADNQKRACMLARTYICHRRQVIEDGGKDALRLRRGADAPARRTRRRRR